VEVDDGWKFEGGVGKELVDWRFHGFLIAMDGEGRSTSNDLGHHRSLTTITQMTRHDQRHGVKACILVARV
jgi:hypothetical protein